MTICVYQIVDCFMNVAWIEMVYNVYISQPNMYCTNIAHRFIASELGMDISEINCVCEHLIEIILGVDVWQGLSYIVLLYIHTFILGHTNIKHINNTI